MKIIDYLQTQTAPQVFTPKAAYDGRKNLFSASQLKFPGGTQIAEVFILYDYHIILLNYSQFTVAFSDAPASSSGRKPKEYKVKLTRVAEINLE